MEPTIKKQKIEEYIGSSTICESDAKTTTTTTTTTPPPHLNTNNKKKNFKILLTAEGNFSYTKSLLDRYSHLKGFGESITATEYTKQLDASIIPVTKQLEEKGVKIMLGVDGREIGQIFKGERFNIIQCNCPFGGSSERDRDEFKTFTLEFFQSASELQKPGDRIHFALDQSKGYWKERKTFIYIERQRENPIVKGSINANYKLIRKRRFGERYPKYRHKKTYSNESFLKDTSVIREFVFEKVDHLVLLTDYDDDVSGHQIKYKDKNNKDLDNAYFFCSTDDEDSDDD
ncbi:hypothetical protein DFA_02355 [Cavenderia fasciculata]|uniref:25S rRNA (uridine-N(3))-methyltransferase BMT5-like domain-containing protein n=1 Tax=Cavenderia fasciculata TaxID=261658 RepID=F4PZ80_CACFS|nr:uncharacterized protein DFA_02355 [Cavenderia fasciculata]EGG19109.1 hypothetical protein DFA_02355 [Cavenderia fasciculata]|eukprot:XP_004366742.1 hypothetical protein DFA_02355 [Cavenderia fasciculata]